MRRLSAVLVCLLVAADVASAQTYHVIAIPLPEGFTENNANGISDTGIVAGSFAPGPHAYVFDPEAGVTALDNLPGGTTSIGFDVDDAGVVVGRAAGLVFANGVFGGADMAVRWTTPTTPVVLASLGDTAAGLAINANGVVAGFESRVAFPLGSSSALAWSATGELLPLDTPAISSRSSAHALNDAGRVVGSYSKSTFETGAFQWDAVGGAVELVGFPDNQHVEAHGVDAAGVAVGASGLFSSDRRAVRWLVPSEPDDLGTLPGDTMSQARAISADGATIVGNSLGASFGDRAFVWTEPLGMRDLNEISDASEIGMTLVYAAAINASGQIAGNGRIGNATRAFVATPVPEPVAAASMIAPVLLWLRWRRAQSAAQK